MAISRLAALGSSVLLVSGVYVEVPVYDSDDRPTEFKDGVPTYIRMTRDNDFDDPLEQFLLCTSCTISYMFGSPDEIAAGNIKKTEWMVFKTDGESVLGQDDHKDRAVPVNFMSTNLQMYGNDKDETPYDFTMDIGYIDPQYQSPMYFSNFKENMIGLAPALIPDGTSQTDADMLLKRQFLYQFANTGTQRDKGYLESFAFNGGESFAVGGNVDDWEAYTCADGADEGYKFKNKGVVKVNAFAKAEFDQNFAPILYYSGADMLLKIQNYIPPMKEELAEQWLAVDTWKRETTLPGFFYDYFMKTFMVPAYTCDPMEKKDLAYPGLTETHACYCNNGDYHTMPSINIEVTGKHFQYDLDPSEYMFLPYLNYTQPMSLCILGLDKTPDVLGEGIEYVSLGQRAMAKFPFYSVFDREANTATVELGGAVVMKQYEQKGWAVLVTTFICVGLVVLLVYLISLRYMRLKAEQWLKENRDILFTHANGLKTEEEILESLVKSKEVINRMSNQSQPTTPTQKVRSIFNEGEKDSMLDGNGTPKRKVPSSGKTYAMED